MQNDGAVQEAGNDIGKLDWQGLEASHCLEVVHHWRVVGIDEMLFQLVTEAHLVEFMGYDSIIQVVRVEKDFYVQAEVVLKQAVEEKSCEIIRFEIFLHASQAIGIRHYFRNFFISRHCMHRAPVPRLQKKWRDSSIDDEIHFLKHLFHVLVFYLQALFIYISLFTSIQALCMYISLFTCSIYLQALFVYKHYLFTSIIYFYLFKTHHSSFNQIFFQQAMSHKQASLF